MAQERAQRENGAVKNQLWQKMFWGLAGISLGVLVYSMIGSGSKWKEVETELRAIRSELHLSIDTLQQTKERLRNAQNELERLHLQKRFVAQQRDSLLYAFKRKNAADWNQKMALGDSLEKIKSGLVRDRALLDKLFGIKK